MSTAFVLNAKVREDMGKGASRRLRRLAQEVPAIVYGGEKKPSNISLAQDELTHALDKEAFYSHIIDLKIDGKSESVILKDVQRHPAKPLILHADFLRVSKTKKLHTRVPLHFINEDTCVGVKQQGGSISHTLTELEISCLPDNLPEYINVDLTRIELGTTLRISDLLLPEGVESVALAHGEDHNLPVVSVIKLKSLEEIEAAAEAAEAAEAPEAGTVPVSGEKPEQDEEE